MKLSIGKFTSLSAVYGFCSCHQVLLCSALGGFFCCDPVQEDERNSREERGGSARPDLDPRSQTGTILTGSVPIGPEVVTGTDGGRGRLHEGQEEKWASRPRAGSSSTSQLQGPLRPTSHPRRRTVTGNTDREALLLPEETTNNRADTSGAAHLTDGPVSPSQATHPYFQNTFSSGPFHTSQSTNTESRTLPGTHTPLNPSAVSGSGNRASTRGPSPPTASHTSELSTSSRDDPSASSSIIPSLISFLPDLPSWITWKGETTLNPHVTLVPGEKQPNSWRSQRSTDRLISDLTSAATSEPLKTPTAQQTGNSGSGPTASTLSPGVQNPGEISSSPTHLTDPPAAVEPVSVHPNGGVNDSVPSVTSNVTADTSGSSEPESMQVFHPFTSPSPSRTGSLQSTELATWAALPHTTSALTQTSGDSSPTPTTLRNPGSVSLVSDWVITASSSTPRTAVTLEDVAQNAAATGSNAGSDSQTQGPAFTLLATVAATRFPHLSSAHSSVLPHTLPTHTGPHSTHMVSTPEPSGPSAHETTPVTTSAVKSTTSRAPHTPSSTPAGADAPATHDESHNFSTAEHLPSSTAPGSEHKHGGEREEEPPSSTPAGPSEKPGTTQRAHPEGHTAHPSDGPTSTTSQTPKFFIVPDQPATIKGAENIPCD